MGLKENLLRGIYAYGQLKVFSASLFWFLTCAQFIKKKRSVLLCSRRVHMSEIEKPSAIQQRGIVPFCKGLDVIQLAQSGTGKTATFCSGVLQQLDYELLDCQALVLAPLLILSSGVHVVVGTPRRVFDTLRRQSLHPDHIKDEADEMLSRGFKDQIYDIFQLLPPKIQAGVSSTTMPHKEVHEQTCEDSCETEDAKQRPYSLSHDHGDMDRDIIMRTFSSGSSQSCSNHPLIRIDVLQVSLVINYDLPAQPENYLHHIGRLVGRMFQSTSECCLTFRGFTMYVVIEDIQRDISIFLCCGGPLLVF
ncbi:hypothetical protein RND71_042415 [Anisodus tanguticus]|uniref:Helicase ATP-binding domain-containing protein n=1 Tax=Anisodus tanguticus TaxID=243964 RepID=A0AAE1UMZ4_9SOLA|nr:hypothetical protein RND71_042415 [Anisodus tanguticus]